MILYGFALAVGAFARPVLIPYSPESTDDNTPQLVWKPESGATSYYVEVDNDGDFSSPFLRKKVSGDTFCVAEIPLPPGRKYWHVSSDLDSNAWSLTDDFIVTTSPDIYWYSPDSTPNKKPLLNWKVVVGSTFYKILIARTADFVEPIVSQIVRETKFQPDLDLPAGPIFWKVSSSYDSNYFSLPDRFTIDTTLVPRLISQAPDPTIDNKPSFTWKSVTGATHYFIEIGNSSNFALPLFVEAKVTGTTSYQDASPLPDGRIFWRVSSSLDSSRFSEPDDFLIGNATAVKRGGNPESRRVEWGGYSWEIPMRTEKASITLFDVSGKACFRAEMAASRFDGDGMPGLKAGTYLMRLVCEDAAGKTIRSDSRKTIHFAD